MMSHVPQDEQLVRALDALEDAGGEVVTLDDLRRGGVHHPALAVYELQAAGVDIDHVRSPGRRRRRAGYRLSGALRG
jgi:Helix-turn-helix domain